MHVDHSVVLGPVGLVKRYSSCRKTQTLPTLSMWHKTAASHIISSIAIKLLS
jgi:hypothetical protein